MNAKKAVEKTIEEYNKYRRPVAIAKLKDFEDDVAVIEISGTFCQTCGIYDYLEDFIYEMDRVTDKYEAEIQRYERVDTNRFIVHYRVKSKG